MGRKTGTKIITDEKMERFRKSLLQAEKSDATVEKYVRDVRKFQTFAGGRSLTPKLALAYKEELKQCGKYKTGSINSFLVALNHFCKMMGWEECCVKTIRVQQNEFETEEKELTRGEYETLVHAAMDEGDEATALIMQTLAGTGIRIGELQYITVECARDGQTEVWNKGKERTVLLPDTLCRILLSYVGQRGILSGSIFCNKKQQPVSRATVWRHMKQMAKVSGVPEEKVFPHNLRHLFAREFYGQTRDIMRLAAILGHSNVNTTRIYIKTTGKEQKKQLEELKMVVAEDAPGTAAAGTDAETAVTPCTETGTVSRQTTAVKITGTKRTGTGTDAAGNVSAAETAMSVGRMLMELLKTSQSEGTGTITLQISIG
jgi:site-specific recombinase XerD